MLSYHQVYERAVELKSPVQMLFDPHLHSINVRNLHRIKFSIQKLKAALNFT